MTITIQEMSDREQWNGFLTSQPREHLLQSYEWGELSQYLGARIYRLGALENGCMVGAMQVIVSSVPMPVPGLHFDWLYCARGPTVEQPDSPALPALVEHAHAIARKEHAVVLRLEPNIADDNPAKACHPERSEGSGSPDAEILRCAQDDSSAEAGLSSVIHICQMVEGMPLGIELAATWGRVLSYEEIAREIEKSLAFLATTSHSILPRHRSIVSVFEPSWSLLSSDERRVFQQLSIFRGGFRREAAERVVGATLTHLAALVDKSLLRYDGAGRYDMHE